MFNIFGQFHMINEIEREKESKKETRNHQDNFFSEGPFNNNFQYCIYCGKKQRFEYDRCVKCKNN